MIVECENQIKATDAQISPGTGKPVALITDVYTDRRGQVQKGLEYIGFDTPFIDALLGDRRTQEERVTESVGGTPQWCRIFGGICAVGSERDCVRHTPRSGT